MAAKVEQKKAQEELRVAKRIAALTVELESANTQTRKARKEWNQIRQEKKAVLRAKVEKAETLPSPQKVTAKDYQAVRSKLDGILMAYQEVDEVEAGRKSAIHECLSRERDLKKAMRIALDNARQMTLFDDVDVEAEVAAANIQEAEAAASA
jgi:hypothetical protein